MTRCYWIRGAAQRLGGRVRVKIFLEEGFLSGPMGRDTAVYEIVSRPVHAP